MFRRLQDLRQTEALLQAEFEHASNKIAELKQLIFLNDKELKAASSKEELSYHSNCLHNFERQLKDGEIEYANCQKELFEIRKLIIEHEECQKALDAFVREVKKINH